MSVVILLPLARAAAMLVVALVVVVLAKLALERALGLDIDEALFEQDNPAVGLAVGGYYAGVAAVLWAALGGSERTFFLDLVDTAAYGALGVALLAAGLKVTAPVLLPGLHIHDELVRDRNTGAGIAVGAAALASGLVAAGAIHGEAPGGLATGAASACGAFVLGQASLAIATRLYRRVVGFDIHDEIRRDNAAAGCALAGAFLGNGILLSWGVSGDLDTARMAATLAPLGLALGAALLLVPAVRFVVSRVFFAGVPFEREIRQDRNLAAGIVDLFSHVLLALLIVRLL